MVSGEDREAKAAQWLQRLQEAAAWKVSVWPGPMDWGHARV